MSDPPTADPARRRMLDVLVVGGGPAGSTVAGLLADLGRSVVLVDRARFPRHKPCGEYVNPGAIGVLERLGLAERVRALGPASVTGWRLMDSSGWSSPADLGPGIEGWGVDRSHLDHTLLEAAKAKGVRVVEGVRVERIEREGPGVKVSGRGSGHWEQRARLVIGADGLRSTVARRVRAVRRPPRLRKFSVTCHVANPLGRTPPTRGVLWVGDRTTVGLAPVRRDASVYNLTVVGDPERDGDRAAADLTGYFLDAAADTGLFQTSPTILAGPWTSGPFDWPVARPTGPGYLLVGDAAGYYDPLTGQGIFRALRGAEIAAGAVHGWLNGERSRDLGVPGYARSLQRAFWTGRAVQRLVEGALSRDLVRGHVFKRLAARPRSAAALVRVTGNVDPPRRLLAPSAWAPLLFGGERGDSGAEHRLG